MERAGGREGELGEGKERKLMSIRREENKDEE